MNIFKKIGGALKKAVKKLPALGALAVNVVANPLGALGNVAKNAIGALGKIKTKAEQVATGARAQLAGTAARAEAAAGLPKWLLPVVGVVAVVLIFGGTGRRGGVF